MGFLFNERNRYGTYLIITRVRLENMNIMCALNKPVILRVLGFGLVIYMGDEFKLIFQKGIGIPLIRNLFAIFKEEIRKKTQGTSIIPFDGFIIFINFFQNENREKLILVYMYDKENSEIDSQLYSHSRKLRNLIITNPNITEIKQICDNSVEIPKLHGVKGLYVIGTSGISYFSKSNRTIYLPEESQLVAGLITALFTFSQHIIGMDSGGKLSEVNFGNQLLYTITNGDVNFVFLVNKMTPLFERYSNIIADEFLSEFQEYLKKFNGDISPFESFNEVINRYFSDIEQTDIFNIKIEE